MLLRGASQSFAGFLFRFRLAVPPGDEPRGPRVACIVIFSRRRGEVRRPTTGGTEGSSRGATAYFTESVSHQAGVHTDEADGGGLRLLAGPAGFVCARVDHERARRWFSIQGLAHGPLDRLRGLFRWDGHEHELRHDVNIGAAYGTALRIEGVRERHLYRWIVLVCAMRRMLWGLYVSWDTDNTYLVLSHWDYDGTSIAENNDSLDPGGLRVHDLREYCGSAVHHTYCGGKLR